MRKEKLLFTPNVLKSVRTSVTKRALVGASAVGLVLTLAAAQVVAQPARYRKKEVSLDPVAQTDLTRPTKPGEDRPADQGPTLTVDQFVAGKQQQKMQIINRQIKQMRRLLQVTPDDDPEKPDLYFRLGDLYSEGQSYSQYRARMLDQPIFEAKGSEKQKLQAKQKRYEDSEKQWLLEAVKAFTRAQSFPRYKRMDQVLFKLAYMLQSVDRQEEARRFYRKLIKDYPGSKYVPHAYLSFAEFFFEDQQMENALKFYNRVEKFPESDIYGYAVYKKAWCYINLEDHRKALEIFVDVINMTERGRGGGAKQRTTLKRQARMDAVKAYARAAPPEKAWEFFRRIGGDMAPKMMERLAEAYWVQGMFAESSQTYRRMMALNPNSAQLCEWQNKVLRNTLSAGTKKDQVREVQRLGATYAQITQSKKASQAAKEECRNVYHDTTRELAFVWHREAQTTKNADTYKLVRYLYKEYLDNFPKEKESYEMAFFYGEILFQNQDWKEAAEQYTRVVEMDPKGKRVVDSAYAAVLAWKNALGIDDRGQGPNERDIDEGSLEKKAIPSYQKKMIAAFDTYIRYVPKAPELVQIKYRKARIYYEYNHFLAAAPLFQDVVENHSEHELAVFAANLLLDCYNAAGQPDKVTLWADRFLRSKKYAFLLEDEEFAGQLVRIKSQSKVVAAKNAEKSGDFKACGEAMLAAFDMQPEDSLAPTRLYDAALCFQNARLIGAAIKTRRELINKFPDSPLAQRAQFQIASGYHQIAFYKQAADNYETFAKRYPKKEQSVTALGNATTFRIGLGDYEQAVDNMNAFIKQYGKIKPKEAADVFYQMGTVYEKEDRDAELERHLELYLSKWSKYGGVDKQILAHFKLGELAWRRSCPVKGQNGACIQVERVRAGGRERAFAELNKRRRRARKKALRRKGRTQCGPPTRSKIVVKTRNARMVKKAEGHFRQVLSLWNRGKAMKRIRGKSAAESKQRAALAAYAAAGSKFYQAEKTFESFLAVGFPSGLDFTPPNPFRSRAVQKKQKARLKAAQKKFKDYQDKKAKLTIALTGNARKKSKGLYGDVLNFKVAHWTIAASARIGQVWQGYADQLFTAPIPKNLKEMDKYGVAQKDLFCDALMDKADPLETKAVEGFDLCLKAATRRSWYNEWSRTCEVELNQMRPSDYPLASEAKPEPGFIGTQMMAAPVVTELPEARDAG